VVVTLSATTSGREAGLPRAGAGAAAGVQVKMIRRRPSGSTVWPNHDSMRGCARARRQRAELDPAAAWLARERRPIAGSRTLRVVGSR
jgi:hypothetical protein